MAITPDLSKLLPQLWNAERVDSARRSLPPGVVLPFCSINGDEGMEGGLAVVVCYTSETGGGVSQTAMLSTDLQTWGIGFEDGNKSLHVSA